MDISGKYVDIETGEIVGYRVENGQYKVALTEDCIRSLDINIEGLDYIQYLDVPLIEVVSQGNRLYMYEDCLLVDKDMPNKVSSFNVWVDGYCFNKYSGVDLDNDYAIREYLLKSGDERNE